MSTTSKKSTPKSRLIIHDSSSSLMSPKSLVMKLDSENHNIDEDDEFYYKIDYH